VFFERVNEEERSHAKVLAPFVEEAINMADSRSMPLTAVALSCGPGSYTSLRIASSTAKGVCYGRNIPLIAIPTTAVMCVPLLLGEELPDDALLCPMIDARRMEVYTATFNSNGQALTATKALILDEESFKDELDKGKVLFTGNGSEKFKPLVNHPNAVFAQQLPHASGMRVIASERLNKKEFKDVAYFEPFYLKDFVAGKPKKLL
jgi:tRNA threonylcarbamoyladenosine biosynthesis protein TsaB